MGSFMESSYHVYVTCGFNEDSSSHLVSLLVDENEGLMRLASASGWTSVPRGPGYCPLSNPVAPL